jgi:hypothetical protein
MQQIFMESGYSGVEAGKSKEFLAAASSPKSGAKKTGRPEGSRFEMRS